MPDKNSSSNRKTKRNEKEAGIEKLLKRSREEDKTQNSSRSFSGSDDRIYRDLSDDDDGYEYRNNSRNDDSEDSNQNYDDEYSYDHYSSDDYPADEHPGEEYPDDGYGEGEEKNGPGKILSGMLMGIKSRINYREEGKKTLEEDFTENYADSKKRLNRSVRRIGWAVALLFISIFSYLIYFQAAMAYDLRTDSGNRRMALVRNRVLRGSILDRDGRIISESRLTDDGSQERIYHGGEAFGPLLGFVSDVYDVTGLESSLDTDLSSEGTLRSLLNYEYIYNLFTGQRKAGVKNMGNSVVTTLDSDLQLLAYGLLSGQKGSVVALDPKTGEILAMVSSPGFDPNDLSDVMSRVYNDADYAKSGVLVNRAVQSTYPPGSTFKAVTLAAALKNIRDAEDEVYSDGGFIEFQDGSKLPNFNGNAMGNISLKEAFAYSSNVVFGKLAMEMGSSRLKETAEDFGFNKKWISKGITPEISMFPENKASQEGLIAQSGIGQGEVTATPLQMAMVAAGTANGGKVMLPQIVKETADSRGTIVSEMEPAVLFSTLDPEIAEKVREYMVFNVESAVGSYGNLQRIDGAGKTGTAEVSSEDGFRLNSWFIGFAPADDPKIAVAVVLEDRDDSVDNFGGAASLPIALEVMERYLSGN